MQYDYVFMHKMELAIKEDDFLKNKSKKERREIAYKIITIVTFVSEITFFLIVPCVIYQISDRDQMFWFAIAHLCLGFFLSAKPLKRYQRIIKDKDL